MLLLEKEGQLRPASGGLTSWPESLVRVVWRSGETNLLADASRDPSFAADLRFSALLRTSVLCAPMKKRGKVIGVVCLENPQLHGAFRPSQAWMAKMLATQAAVAPHNAWPRSQMRGLLERQVDMTSVHALFVPHAFRNNGGFIDSVIGDAVLAASSTAAPPPLPSSARCRASLRCKASPCASASACRSAS